MLAFVNTFLYKSIWRIRHIEKIRSVFEVGSEQFINFKSKAGWADVEDDSSVCENEEC